MSLILVIDDEPLMRRTLRTALEQAGHDVLEASDGNDGLAKALAAGPDLVLTDIIMPNREGVETIGELRRAQPDLPIIAISGGGRMGAGVLLELARGLGATRTMSKPIRNADLLQAVRECLEGSAAPQSPAPDGDLRRTGI